MAVSTLDRLYEQTSQGNLRVDRTAGVLRGVKVIGRHSKNGREYSDKAMRQLAGMYEGVAVNIDHPAGHQPHRERGLAEKFGELRNVTRRANGIFADLHYSKSHSLAEHVADLAERMPNQLGLSHNAEGSVVQVDGKNVVESIARVLSVDVVGRPATNAGLFEGRNSGPTPQSISGDISQLLSELVAMAARDSSKSPKQTAKAVDDIERAKGNLLSVVDKWFPTIESGRSFDVDAEPVAESYNLARRDDVGHFTLPGITRNKGAAHGIRVN